MEFLEYVVAGLMTGGIYALLGIGIVLVCKATQIVSLAHGQIVFFGAFFVWLFYTGWGLPIALAIVLGLLLAGIMGFLIERFTMRPMIGQPTASAFLVTLAMFMALDGAGQLVLKGGTRAFTPPFIPLKVANLGAIQVPQTALWGFIIAVVVGVILWWFFRYTRMGLAMRITAEDHMVAQSMGIRVKGVFSWVWIISALVTGIAGILLACKLDIFYTLPVIGFKGMIVALFGGLESLPGALLAGLLLGLFERLSAAYVDPLSIGGLAFTGFSDTFAYILLLIILIVRPYGLFGLVRIERI